MISVCFVCLGNICRSPTAELVFSKMVEEEGLSHSFEIFSRGTSDCEEGNPIYPPARATLEKHGVSGAHRAAQLTLRDVINVDYLIVMDSSNLMDVLALTAGRFGEKIYKLMSFANAPPGRGGSVVYKGLRTRICRYMRRLPCVSRLSERGEKRGARL